MSYVKRCSEDKRDTALDFAWENNIIETVRVWWY